ncbi:MAG TPA: wax ester/triacylglycerol synthase domain-containing protein, partial [Nocardioidaceae bacterium]
MSRRLIGPVDTIWLNMDRPNNLMVIDTLMFLQGAVDWDRLVQGAQQRMLDRYPVFRQRPVMPRSPVGLPHWEDDPDFDLDRHVRRARLERGDDAALQDYLSVHNSRPFDRSHPLWEIHLIDGYDAGPVVFCRLHHALADGVALARVLLSLTDATPEGAQGADSPEAWFEEEVHPPEELGLVDGAVRVAEAAASAANAAAAYGTGILRQLPRLLRPRIVSDAFTQTEKAVAVADKLLLTGRPQAPYAGTPGVSKREVWCEPFPLDDVKNVGHAAGATVNDVMIAALAGALATYTREHGGEPRDHC